MVCPRAGFERTKQDVIRVVHIGASTLAKRVNEFAGTSASEYTRDDFEVRIAAFLSPIMNINV